MYIMLMARQRGPEALATIAEPPSPAAGKGVGVIECSTLEFTALPFRWCLMGSLRLTRN